MIANQCQKCAHRPNSLWKYGQCRCIKGYTLYGTECLPNNVGSDSPEDCLVSTFFDSQQKRCLPCPQGCLSCESSYKCTQCSVDFNFNIASDLCIEFCGDGKRYNLPCDDGNNIDGDGCSRNCEVEIGYICRGGSPNSVDDCILYQPTDLTLIQTGYIRYSTRIIINIKVDYVPR